ncbi:hypothetical protein AB0O07_26775 [Streptomyces sp. NPDC093085]|uniref:hypothetical protein n=1 Tax=Streptomyces sp. NPDC093085 TaxID=3155068 RepID=UPI00341FEA8D
MSARPLTGANAYPVEAGRRLLADMERIDWLTVTEADLAFLVGRTKVVVASLIATVEGAER